MHIDYPNEEGTGKLWLGLFDNQIFIIQQNIKHTEFDKQFPSNKLLQNFDI